MLFLFHLLDYIQYLESVPSFLEHFLSLVFKVQLSFCPPCRNIIIYQVSITHLWAQYCKSSPICTNISSTLLLECLGHLHQSHDIYLWTWFSLFPISMKRLTIKVCQPTKLEIVWHLLYSLHHWFCSLNIPWIHRTLCVHHPPLVQAVC